MATGARPILPPDSDSMQVGRTQITGDPKGVIECKVTPSGGWGGRRLSCKTSTIKSDEDYDTGNLGVGEPFMMPSDSGSTKEFTEGDPGDHESISITVLAVPNTK